MPSPTTSSWEASPADGGRRPRRLPGLRQPRGTRARAGVCAGSGPPALLPSRDVPPACGRIRRASALHGTRRGSAGRSRRGGSEARAASGTADARGLRIRPAGPSRLAQPWAGAASLRASLRMGHGARGAGLHLQHHRQRGGAGARLLAGHRGGWIRLPGPSGLPAAGRSSGRSSRRPSPRSTPRCFASRDPSTSIAIHSWRPEWAVTWRRGVAGADRRGLAALPGRTEASWGRSSRRFPCRSRSSGALSGRRD